MAEQNIKKKPAQETQVPRGTVWVRSTREPGADGGHPVALWEKHSRHPRGEAYIAGPLPVEVALTPEVKKLLRDGILEEIADPDMLPKAEK